MGTITRSKAAPLSFSNIVDTGTEGTKVATGTTAQQGSTTGQIRFNTTTGLAEYYNGSAFTKIEGTPSISSISPNNIDIDSNALPQNITITGVNFQSGATVTFVDSAGVSVNSTSVTFTNTTTLVAQVPNSVNTAQQPFDVRVNNPTGLTATLTDGLQLSASPTWTTASGSLGNIGDKSSANLSVVATDPDGGAITFSETTSNVLGGAGLSLNTSTGAITGDPNDVSGDTTINFDIRATDNESATADRSFAITIQQALDGSSSGRAVTHPDALATLGLSSGNYYIQGMGGATRQMYCVINGVGSKNWVKLTPATFFELLTPSTVGTTNQGWGTLNGRRYYRAYASSIDTEGWVKWDMGTFSFRYIHGDFGWAPNGSSLGSGHPDNNAYGNYHTGDTDFNSRGYGASGTNISWHRFGITDQFQLAYDELGSTGSSERYPIYIGDKTTNFKSGVSRVAGADNANSYIDLGSSAGNREFKWSACQESGVASEERIAWSPTNIYIS